MKTWSAAKWIGICFGVPAGFYGIFHGLGEALQGSVTSAGLFFASWATGPVASNMGGEPAMSLIPNLLVTGILAMLVSSLTLVWAAGFLRNSRAGWVLIMLSVGMLLVGGGMAPPITGILAGAAATGVGSAYPGWGKILKGGFRRFLARSWRWVFALCLANGVFLFLGSLVLVLIFDFNHPYLFTYSFFALVLSFPINILCGIAWDLERA